MGEWERVASRLRRFLGEHVAEEQSCPGLGGMHDSVFAVATEAREGSDAEDHLGDSIAE